MSLRIVIRYRVARSRLARFVSGSLAAHGVLAAVILFVPLFHRAPPSFDDAMVVALAGPLPGPPAASARAAAPPSPSRPEPPPKAPPPKEAHAVREIPKPVPKKKEAPAPPSATPAPAPPTTDPDPSGPPEGGSPGSASGATGVTAVLGGGDASLGFYGAAVKAALEAAWIRPFLEDQGETYSATVTFVIARDGTARDVRIAESSGVPSLDRSAVRAVMEASPLPPIPPSWTGDALPATMRFDLTPEGP